MISADFADLGRYLAHYEKQQSPALLPVQVVAFHRGVGKATVIRMLDDDRLDGVKIENDVYVTVKSYLSQIQRERDRDKKAQQFIERFAREGKILTYEPVMDHIGLSWRSPPHRTLIAEILGRISEKSYEQHGIFLTAIVHRKYGSTTKPGKGYFQLVENITGQKPKGDEAEAVKAEVTKVFDHYRSSKHKSGQI